MKQMEEIRKDNHNEEQLSQRFGEIYLELLDENKREAGYSEMEKLLPEYPEAGIVLGQYYQQSDRKRAKAYFKAAADAGIAEGMWGYAGTISHSNIPNLKFDSDREWVMNCQAAAEGGCADAANEMGNICSRKGFFAESMYWYGMAYVLEQTSAMAGLRGITGVWLGKGSPKEYVRFLDNYTEDRHNTALILLKMFSSGITSADLNQLMTQAMGGESLAGFFAGLIYGQNKMDEMEYQAYNVTAFEKHPHALRCYADMLMAGKGCERDPDSAIRFYKMAADKGNAPSMFVMGEYTRNAGDLYQAAAWYGKAYSRGYEFAADRLSQMI